MLKKVITLICKLFVLMFFVGVQNASLYGSTTAKKAAGAINKSECAVPAAKRATQDTSTTISDILKLEDENGRFLENPTKNAELIYSVKSLNLKCAKGFDQLDKALQNVGTQTSEDEQVLQALQRLFRFLFNFDVAIDVVDKNQGEIGPKIVRPFQAPLARLSSVLLGGGASNSEILKTFKNEFLSVGTAVILADVNAMVTGQENQCSLLRSEAIGQIFAALVFISEEGGFTADASKQISLANHRGLLDVAKIEEEACNHDAVNPSESLAELEQAAKPQESSGGSGFRTAMKWGFGLLGGTAVAALAGTAAYKVYQTKQKAEKTVNDLGDLVGEMRQNGLNQERKDRFRELVQNGDLPGNIKEQLIETCDIVDALPEGVNEGQVRNIALRVGQGISYYNAAKSTTNDALQRTKNGVNWVRNKLPWYLGGASAEQEEQEEDGDYDDSDDVVESDGDDGETNPEDDDDDSDVVEESEGDEFFDAAFVLDDEIVADDEGEIVVEED